MENPVVYKNLEAERSKLNLTQLEFANLIGIKTVPTYKQRLKKGGWMAEELKLLRQNVSEDLNYLLEHYGEESKGEGEGNEHQIEKS